MRQPSSRKSLSGRRIIVVEKDAELRISLVRFLGILGYEVVAAGTALEFYRMIDYNRFSLAILNVGVSDPSGLALVEYLRSNTLMHIVMMVTNATIEDRLSCYRAGADILLEKPLDFRELSALIGNIFARIDNCSSSGALKQGISDSLVRKQNEEYAEFSSWKIMTDGWRLISPRGDAIELTLKEFRFLTTLSSTSSVAVSRHELLKTLEYRNDEYGNRALESLVHRLRSKTDGLGCSPIKTAHGIGYSFAAPVKIL
jgi:DNA-binding response OmpR family regulator